MIITRKSSSVTVASLMKNHRIRLVGAAHVIFYILGRIQNPGVIYKPTADHKRSSIFLGLLYPFLATLLIASYIVHRISYHNNDLWYPAAVNVQCNVVALS